MSVVTIGPRYTVKIPESLRARLRVGQQMTVTMDEQGRLILTPVDQALAVLQSTFGIWAERPEIPDGVTYVDQIRHGHRLHDWGIRQDETD